MPVSPKQREAEEKVKLQKQTKPTCIACGDTGLNSRGGICIPCEKARRIKSDKPV